jgi:hypothetical protein
METNHHRPRYPDFLSSAESATNLWGTRLFVVLPAVANTNRGLIENLFLIRKPHTRSCLVPRQEIRVRWCEGHPSGSAAKAHQCFYRSLSMLSAVYTSRSNALSRRFVEDSPLAPPGS